MACFLVGFPDKPKYAPALSSERCSFMKPSSSFFHPLHVRLREEEDEIHPRAPHCCSKAELQAKLRQKFLLLMNIKLWRRYSVCLMHAAPPSRPPSSVLNCFATLLADEALGVRYWIQFLDVPRIRFSQFSEKTLGERFSSVSAKISRPSSNLGRKSVRATRKMATSFENRQVFDSKSRSPSLFDGTTRLYFSARCPYARRVWVAVKYKGLDEIECVEISLSDKPAWYKETVYPVGKVPSLEHDGKVTGESMDLLTYLDEHFGGPKLAPTDESKKQAAAEILEYADTFDKIGFTGLSMKDSTPNEIGAVVAPALDFLENALGKFSSEEPFLLGNFGLVDIAYAPFVERFEIAFGGIRNYDIKAGRPKLTKWIEALDNVEAYSSTKADRSTLLELYKKMLDNDSCFKRVDAVSDQSNSGGTPVAVN